MSNDRREAVRAARAARATSSPAPVAAPAAAPVAAQAAPAKMTLPPTDARAPVPPEGRVVFQKDDWQVKQVPRGTKAPPGGFQNQGQRGGPMIVGGPGAKSKHPRPDSANFVMSSGRSNPNVRTVPGGRPPNVQPVQRVQTQSQTGVAATMIAPTTPQPNVARGPDANLSIVLGYNARIDVIESQQRLLLAQSVTPRAIVSWLNPHESARVPPHVLATLMRMPCIQPNVDMGPWMRWGIASQCQTEFVAVFDDDTMPGPRWLESAVARLSSSDDHDIVAAGGLIYNSDDAADVRPVGPEAPPTEEVEVDVGRGAWVMRTSTAREIVACARAGGFEVLSTGLHLAAVVQQLDGGTIVLPYGRDHATWGMLEPPRQEGSIGARIDQDYMNGQAPHSAAEVRAMIYAAHREAGWMPWCVVMSDESGQMNAIPEEASEAAG